MPYNSNYTGASVEEILAKVVDAQPATASAAGKGGLIPAPPAGSQDGSKVLKSNLTWGETDSDIEALDLSVLLKNDTGLLTQEQYDLIQNAISKNVLTGIIDGTVYPIAYSYNAENRFIKMSIIYAIISGEDVVVYCINIDIRQDKTYSILSVPIISEQRVNEYTYFMSKDPAIANTLANLSSSAHNIIANVSAATSLSVESGLKDGWGIQVRVNNTTSSVITQPIPTTGNYDCLDGTSVEIPANGFIELNIWYINGKYVIRVGQKQ